jgi:hypothetical protein
MSEQAPYRDELAAAHARIAALEKNANANGRISAAAARLAALQRERMHLTAASDSEQPMQVRPIWVHVVLLSVGVAFLRDRDWVLACMAVLAIPLIQWLNRANVAKARRDGEVFDEQIRKAELALEREAGEHRD